jgi:DNA-binding NarL/FixJ family response regulator
LQVRNGHAHLPHADDAPSGIDRDLLPLLAAGFTDQAIASQLGCNERTVRRYLKDMMHRLDAVTRFQAGYQAIRRGWLTTDRTASA